MLIFYPNEGELDSSSTLQKLEVLLEMAERYKAAVLDTGGQAQISAPSQSKRIIPRDMKHAYNWDELAKLLRIVHDSSEVTPNAKSMKADQLNKLAAIYEVLRGAKMPKLEAVRLALVSEANQLKNNK